MKEMSVMEMGNMSTLEEKVDTLIRYCVAESATTRQFYQWNLRDLLWDGQKGPAGEQLAVCIERVLADLGVPEHLLGYGYLRSAVEIAVNDPETVHYVTGLLYPKVAKCHRTSAALVERAIRNAIQSGWDRCGETMQLYYFGGVVRVGRSRPTNTEYIARMANIIRRQMLQ